MPRAKQTLNVDVSETTAEDVRTITVTITAPAQDFLLSDLLRQRGAVGSVDMPLKQAVKDALQKYLDGVEELIAGVATNQKKGSAGTKVRVNTGVTEATGHTENGSKNGTTESTEMAAHSAAM